MTLEEEFQKPVRERLDQIVIPDTPSYQDWPQHTVPVTNYDQWMRQALSFQDTQVSLARAAFDDIANGHGIIAGTFPSPVKRKRKRTRK
jgi:hypothetical protein